MITMALIIRMTESGKLKLISCISDHHRRKGDVVNVNKAIGWYSSSLLNGLQVGIQHFAKLRNYGWPQQNSFHPVDALSSLFYMTHPSKAPSLLNLGRWLPTRIDVTQEDVDKVIYFSCIGWRAVDRTSSMEIQFRLCRIVMRVLAAIF
jgi:hypothetical protein